jgi:hypothetical protein
LKKIVIVLVVFTLVNLNFFHLTGDITTRRFALVLLTFLWLLKFKSKLKNNIKNINLISGSIIIFSLIMSILQNTILEFNYQLLQFVLLFYTINIINLVVLSYNLHFNIRDLFFFTKTSFFLILLYCLYILLYEPINLQSLYLLRNLNQLSPNFSLNILINTLVVVSVISIFSCILSKGLERFLLINITLFFLIIILFSFSRQSIFAILGVFMIIIFHYFKKMKWLYFLLFPTIVFLFIDDILFFSEIILQRFGGGGDTKRIFAYTNGFNSFLNSPWGVGLGNYSLLNQTNFKVTESGHLQVLVELGLFYYLAYLFGIYKLIKRLKHIINPTMKLLTVSIFFVIIWTAFFNEIIFTTITFIPLYFFLTQTQTQTQTH